MTRLGKLEGFLLFSFLTLFGFSLQYIFRSLDQSTLTNWNWFFTTAQYKQVLMILTGAILFNLIIACTIRLEKYPLIILTALSLACILPLWSEPELLLDAGRYFIQAKALSQYGLLYFWREWGHAVTAWTDLPLVPFLYGLLLKFSNESRTALQLFNTLIFVLSVLLTYGIGSRLWNRETGFYGGLLLLGIPYLLTQVPQMLVDIHTMFFHLLAVFCVLQALSSQRRSPALLAGITLAMALLVKYSTWPMLLVLPVALVFTQPVCLNRDIFAKIMIITGSAIFLFLLFCFFKFDVISEQIGILLAYQQPALQLWDEGFVSLYFFQIQPFITIFAMYACFLAYQRKDRRFLFLFLYGLLSIFLQVQRIRYFIPFMPFIALMAAYGLAVFRENLVKRFAAMMTVTASLGIVFVGYLPFFYTTSMMNLKTAAEHMDSLAQDTFTVIAGPQDRSEGSTMLAVPILDLYTEKKLVLPQDWPGQPADVPALSPLLFTWMTKKPAYYIQGEDYPRLPVVILSAHDPDENLYATTSPLNEKRFTRETGIFRYRTLVAVYH